MGLFTGDVGVLASGHSYLRIVGPAYAGLGAGLVLFFAAQETGRVLQPLIAGFTRLIVAAAGGYLATRVYGLGLSALYAVMAAGLAGYGLVMILVTRRELGLIPSPENSGRRLRRTCSVPTRPFTVESKEQGA